MTKLSSRLEPFASLPPIGAGSAQWAKTAWYLAKTVGPAIAWKAFDYGTEIFAASGTDAAGEADEWRRFRCRYADTASLDAADDQVFSVDVINYTGGVVDNSWTDADHQAVASAVSGFCTSIAPNVAGRLELVEITAYRMAFNDYGFTKPDGTKPPFAESGGPTFAKAYAIVGSAAGQGPPQGTSTITERTPLRRNWGRLYLPTLATTTYGIDGRLTSATATALANAYAGMVGTLHGQEMHVVVPTTMVGGVPTRALQGITAVACDDVADVHRSRRHHTPKFHWIVPAPAATKPADDAELLDADATA